MSVSRWTRVAASALVVIAPTVLSAQTYPSRNDPRNGLKSGLDDAGVAISGMRVLGHAKKAAEFDTTDGLRFANSDLAFKGHYVYQGNFAGFTIWDVSNPASPKKVSAVSCITSQGDPTILGNLLFISAEGAGNRNDCGKQGVQDPKEHMAGVRIFDVSNPAAPKLVKNVQTCKGSHTHTLIPHPSNKNIVYLYVSGSQGARAENDMPGCKANDDAADTSNVMYRLDVIKVPLNAPEKAEVVTGARIFTGLEAAPRSNASNERAAQRAAQDTSAAARAAAAQRNARFGGGPRNCHDVTAYPAVGLLAGACGSYGLLVDIRNPEKPVRLDAAADTNFSLWHTAVFSNDGSKVVFTDEWGGGTSPNCQANHPLEMGGNTTLVINKEKKYKQHAYFKIPTAQAANENCVSHNGGLIPVPGRDIMVQGWYQGGIDVIDFTDPDKPKEIAYFDRGPVDAPPPIDQGPGGSTRAAAPRSTIGGSWGAYYYNGMIISSEMARGLDLLELTPSEHLSENEIAAAKLVKLAEYNPQSQPKLVWPAAFPVVRSYLDQLVRNEGLAPARTTAIDAALTAAEKATGAARKTALTRLATQVDADARGAKDAERVRWMADAIRKLAAATK